jgi:uncharacterized protein (TIGR00730 family)
VNSPDAVAVFLRDLAGADASPERRKILRTLVTRLVGLVALDPDDGDLKVAATVLDELLLAANVFSPWRDHPKLTVFGSARTKADTPLYDMAAALGAAMAERGWITVSGAGPGIMEAAARGAGRENTLGVNIDLPFEQNANPYIDAETRLVEMKYFFTRKVALTKESIAFAIFPGGLGTQDEAFEILTLLHTGKSSPAPVALVDTPDGTYWDTWLDFVKGWMIAAGYLDEVDVCLFRICRSVEETIAEVEHFYSNYVGFELNGALARVKLHRPVSAAMLDALAREVPAFASGAGYRVDGTGLLTFDFDGRQYVALRRVIDVVNANYSG